MIVKNFSGIDSLEIKSSVKVSIVKGSEFKVKVSGDEADKVKIEKLGSCVSIEYFKESSGITYIGDTFLGNTFVSSNVITANSNNSIFIGSGGKNISIINGEVFINGKKVEESLENFSPKQPVEIEVECPNNLDLDCELTSVGSLVSLVEFERVRLNMNGMTSADIKAKSGKFIASGSSNITYNSLGGNFKASVSGSGNINVCGTIQDVEASVSGSGKISTRANVKGDYDASVSGSGNIYHSGTITGKKYKSVSGSGSIKL